MMPTTPLFRRYLLWAFTPLIVLYLLPFAVLRLPGYERWTASEMGRVLDYGFTVRQDNSDVVILGDSTALYGLAPREMSEALGVRVINLGNTLMSLPVSGPSELTHYLKHNRRPRLIVFYIDPWNLDYNHGDLSQLYDGEEMLIRYGSMSEFTRFLIDRPSSMLVFSFQFYVANPPKYILHNLIFGSGESSIILDSGHKDFPGSKQLQKDCALSPHLARLAPSVGSAQQLLNRFQGAADKVILYVAPVPACSGLGAALQLPYRQLNAAAPKLLAPEQFGDDKYYGHAMPGAVHDVTQQLIEAIRPMLKDTPEKTLNKGDKNAF